MPIEVVASLSLWAEVNKNASKKMCSKARYVIYNPTNI